MRKIQYEIDKKFYSNHLVLMKQQAYSQRTEVTHIDQQEHNFPQVIFKSKDNTHQYQLNI